MNKLLVITGPTATGKTALGLEFAEKYNGEVVSADSRQVYKYMDIGTGKDTKHFQWGLDLVLPNEQFNVSDFVVYAQKVLDDIWNREKLPIIVGGTGLYIKELLNPSQTLHIPPDQELRSKGFELRELQNMLQRVNEHKWKLMNNSDKNNPRRLMRAIEVAGKVASSFTPRNDTLIIGLTAAKEVLGKRIEKRVDERIAVGMEKEKGKLAAMGYFPNAFGYKEKTAAEWKLHEKQYAKRQILYLQKYLPETIWINISNKRKAFDLVATWYSKHE